MSNKNPKRLGLPFCLTPLVRRAEVPIQPVMSKQPMILDLPQVSEHFSQEEYKTFIHFPSEWEIYTPPVAKPRYIPTRLGTKAGLEPNCFR